LRGILFRRSPASGCAQEYARIAAADAGGAAARSVRAGCARIYRIAFLLMAALTATGALLALPVPKFDWTVSRGGVQKPVVARPRAPA
jgi:hypothetical protein